jgi:hypothetical protein
MVNNNQIRSHLRQQHNRCQIFRSKSVIYGEVIKVVNEVEKFDSFVQPDVLLVVKSTINNFGRFEDNFGIRLLPLRE